MFLDDTRYFESYDEAFDFLEENFAMVVSESGKVLFWYPFGVYELHHGEYESPSLFIGKNKNGFYVWIKYFYYNGTFNAKKDGPMTNDYYGRLAIGF